MNKEITELKDLLKKRYDDEINTTNLFENIEFVLQELDKYKNIVDKIETYLQRKYSEYVDMESDDAFVISLVLDTLRELKGE